MCIAGYFQKFIFNKGRMRRITEKYITHNEDNELVNVFVFAFVPFACEMWSTRNIDT